MSNDKLYNISNIQMLLCGNDWWDEVVWLITDILPVFGPQDCLAGIVISVKNLGLKFLPYIAGITGF